MRIDIKYKKVFLEKIYDLLYIRASNLLKQYNPCKIENNSCIASREQGQCDACAFCCHGCKYLGNNGCTVKSLSCKIWLCSHLKKSNFKTNHPLIQGLYTIESIGNKYNLLIFRGSKEDSIKKALGYYDYQDKTTETGRTTV